MTEKTVTIGIRMDSEFVRLLNANVELSQLRQADQLEPIKQLALIALLEARGALEEQVHIWPSCQCGDPTLRSFPSYAQ